jgi:phospholipid-binding lipoprotein MlaA
MADSSSWPRFPRWRSALLVLTVLAGWGATARAHALSPDATLAIAGAASALGASATEGPALDPSGAVRANAEARMASVVITLIAADPASHAAIMAASVAAAPALAEGMHARVILAFPGFAASLVALPAPGPKPGVAANAENGVAEDDVAFADLAAEASAGPPIEDPFEDFNRAVFALNDAIDTLVLKPIASVYGFAVPLPLKRAIASAYRNLKSPVILANDLFQGEVTDGAAVTLGRFLINSTVGIAGLADAAAAFGLPGHDNDFGQTLFSYGLDTGPYLVLPLFGPSTLRDAVGTAADSVLDPLGYVLPFGARLAINGGKAVSKREAVIDQIDQLKLGAIDYYAAARGAYYQHRAEELGGAEATAGPMPPSRTSSRAVFPMAPLR